MREIEQRAAAAFEERFGAPPAVVASAPGRVNLIGEHTDYSGGFVFPCAIDRRVAVAIGPGEAAFYSADFNEERLGQAKDSTWADYPRGVLWSLMDAGHTLGTVRATITGDIPLASGLSSSAAIESAVAVAVDALFDLRISRRDLALLCQRAENNFVGVNCGIMDQYTSLLGEDGAALLVDCRSLDAEAVPLDLDRAGLTLLVCDTRVRRGLGATAYNERRKSCERAAIEIGVPMLRDATAVDLARLSDPILKRARHVVTENARVLAAVQALRAADYAEFGRLMYASHASLRDDFEVSIPELDTFVELASSAGALGARLTGAGFGGCAIALIPTSSAETLANIVRARYQERRFKEPAFYHFRPSPGAAVIR